MESYARLSCVKTSISFLLYDTETTRTTYQVRDTRYLYSSSSYSCRYSLPQVPRSYCCTKRVIPLGSSHGHQLPARAASARAARGRCFDPKGPATVPGCRGCSASREHRSGSLLIIGQDQTQGHSNIKSRSSSTTREDGSHPPHRPPPMPH